MRNLFWQFTVLVIAVNAILVAFDYPGVLWSLILFGPLILLGIHDVFQTRHSILRNFPVLGHFRFFFEEIRPEIHQYFVESDTGGVPFNRQQRTVVYQRAKNEQDTVPFGTERALGLLATELDDDICAPSMSTLHGSLRSRLRRRLISIQFN